jgi:DNA polymerase-3 subunit epsilon
VALSFCAIDFETANSFRGSPCAVGLVKVIDGRIVARQHYLLRPPPDYDHFDAFNVRLHGITPEMVRHEPRFGARLHDILDFADGLPFVAHNAAFDMGVIRDACLASDVAWPDADYACTLVLSRLTWSLLSYSLPWVADAAGAPTTHHHDAKADATAAAAIALAIADHHGATSLEELATTTKATMGYMRADEWSGFHRLYQWGKADLPATNVEADPNHPFFDQDMVFTGRLFSMTRAMAWQRVAAVGARPAIGVTKTTSILVMGFQDAVYLRPGETLSARARKAHALRERGQRIELLPEADFTQQLML